MHGKSLHTIWIYEHTVLLVLITVAFGQFEGQYNLELSLSSLLACNTLSHQVCQLVEEDFHCVRFNALIDILESELSEDLIESAHHALKD